MCCIVCNAYYVLHIAEVIQYYYHIVFGMCDPR